MYHALYHVAASGGMQQNDPVKNDAAGTGMYSVSKPLQEQKQWPTSSRTAA
jgi:hypothetical protein